MSHRATRAVMSWSPPIPTMSGTRSAAIMVVSGLPRPPCTASVNLAMKSAFGTVSDSTVSSGCFFWNISVPVLSPSISDSLV